MAEARIPKPTYHYRANLIRVIDGDTVVLRLDMGLRISAEIPVRLNGLNTAELREAKGHTIKGWVIDWFSAHTEITVETQKDPEKYGRWLGEIFAVDDGQSLNAALLAAGLAKPWDGQGARPS